VAILALTFLGAVLRFATLDVQSIWLDESATIHLVDRGFGGMLSHLSSSESTPPLYYVLVWLWTQVFGGGVLAFRSFSALAGVLTVPVLYAAGRQISPRAGFWAGALTALSPIMYYYSQEIRSYALLILFCAAAFLCWQRALAQPDGRRLAWWAAMSILALLTHYFAAFLFIPEALLLVRRLGLQRARVAIGAVLLAGLALLPLAIAQRSSGNSDWIQSSSLASRLAQPPKQFLVGLYGPHEIVTALLGGLLAAGAIFLLVRYAGERERLAARDVAIVAVAGLALPAVLAVTRVEDVFNGRNVIAVWVPFAVLVAAGLGAARAPRLGAALGAGLCALFALVIVLTDTKPAYQRDDWRTIAGSVKPLGAGGVVVAPVFGIAPLSVYVPAVHQLKQPTVTTSEIAVVDLRTRRTGRSPLPPVVPTSPPPGFRLVSVSRSTAVATARFRAPRPQTVKLLTLRRLRADPTAEVIVRG
jgi:hypothetical protein